MSANEGRKSNSSHRDDEDAAAAVVVLTLLAGQASGASEPTEPSAWGDPSHRLRISPAPSATAWWTSGLPH